MGIERDSKKMRRKRIKLWKVRKGKCVYCGAVTIHPKFKKEGGGTTPLNAATIDHVYSKNDIRRFTERGKWSLVLSCYECNKNKNIRERCVLSDNTYKRLYPPFDIRELLHMEKQQNG